MDNPLCFHEGAGGIEFRARFITGQKEQNYFSCSGFLRTGGVHVYHRPNSQTVTAFCDLLMRQHQTSTGICSTIRTKDTSIPPLLLLVCAYEIHVRVRTLY
jgi:hypothetical protein